MLDAVVANHVCPIGIESPVAKEAVISRSGPTGEQIQRSMHDMNNVTMVVDGLNDAIGCSLARVGPQWNLIGIIDAPVTHQTHEGIQGARRQDHAGLEGKARIVTLRSNDGQHRLSSSVHLSVRTSCAR